MKVTQISTRFSRGGAALIGRFLFEGLPSQGVKSSFLYGYGKRGADDELAVGTSHSVLRLSNIGRIGTNYAAHRIFNKELLRPSAAGQKLLSAAFESSDAVHIHGIHSYYFPLTYLRCLMESSSTRLCITLHDYWWLTGRCAFLDGCSNYLKGCGACPTLANYPPVSMDRSGSVIREKRRFLEDFASRISFISPCRYIGQQAFNALGSHFSIDCIHNVVRLPAIDRSELLPNQSPILRILVTAADYSGEHKYSDNFLTRLASLPRTTLTVVGLNPPTALQKLANTNCLGRLDAGEVSKQMINADIFVMEGKNEIYPLTLLEALAHGMLTFSVKTPATSEVSEEIGGVVFDSHEDLLDALAVLATSGNELLSKELRYHRIIELQKTLSMEAFVKKHIGIYSRNT